MKKFLLVALFAGSAFTALPCSGSYYACGSQDVAQVIQSGIDNCPIGSSFTVVDVCNNNHEFRVRVEAIQ